ncbi:hypothetical protein [Kribbella speibonae]|uniref:Uncharacterized protein n=1 Tax=Kribbella speibonae TaxID=1572660 RepID=A0A4R0I9V5_9ACTN|nr:hypothetical protein [Kribbella speibonae]TCC29069.1 hypothetical protein E0H92_43630 [Kribbella speibonae]
MDKDLARARSAASRLEVALSGALAFDEGLAHEYNRARKALAAAFQAMALEAVPRDQFDLDEVKRSVSSEMRRLFEGRVDSSLFVVGGYTAPHPDAYAVLASRLGEPVPAWRLRLLSGDKIHTERRTRELRDLGFDVEVTGSQDNQMYCLTSLEPNLRYAAAFQLRKKASKAKKLTRLERTAAIDLAERTAELPPRKESR